MSADPLLVINDIHLHFGGVRALNGVSLTVKSGEFLGIIGPNGAGKTTMFNVITGVLKPNSGSVKFDNHELTKSTPDQICRLGIARTYQRVRPFSRLTVMQNAMVPIVNRDRPKVSIKEARGAALMLLDRVGLRVTPTSKPIGSICFIARKSSWRERSAPARALSCSMRSWRD
jgi:branched-chain amino acid transport system ATP-binding protein